MFVVAVVGVQDNAGRDVEDYVHITKDIWNLSKFPYTANRLVVNKAISGCVRMACDSLLTTSLLQVVKRLLGKLIVKICYPQDCCKLFQQVVKSPITNFRLVYDSTTHNNKRK